MTALEIQLPDDFEGKYEEFRMRVLGEYHKKSVSNQSSAIPKFQLDWAHNKLQEIKKEEELTDRILAKVEDKFLPQNSKKEGEEWWKLGSLPSYKRDDYLIILEDRKCDIGSTALNQQVICEFIFNFDKKPLGEWLVEYEVKDAFSNRGKKPGNRAFGDAVEDLNKKIKRDLGIEGMLEYKSGPPKTRIKPSLFQKENLVKENTVNSG